MLYWVWANLSSVEKYSGNVLREHSADSIVHCDSIYVVNVHVSTSGEGSLGVLSLTLQKHPPASLHPPEIHLYTFWCFDGGHAQLQRCPAARQASVKLSRFVVALQRPAEMKDAAPMQCAVAAVVWFVWIKVDLNSDPRRRLSV